MTYLMAVGTLNLNQINIKGEFAMEMAICKMTDERYEDAAKVFSGWRFAYEVLPQSSIKTWRTRFRFNISSRILPPLSTLVRRWRDELILCSHLLSEKPLLQAAKRVSGGSMSLCNKGDEIMADGYMDMICRAQTLDDLDRIVEAAANNFNITNKEYAEVYERSLQKAKSWANI